VFVGDANLECGSDYNGSGYSQAWPFTATISATASSIGFSVDAGTTQGQTVQLGVYGDNSEGRPGDPHVFEVDRHCP
jgi:hypothetical protein